MKRPLLTPRNIFLALFAILFLTAASGIVIYQGSLIVPSGGSIQDLNQLAGCAQYSNSGVLSSIGAACVTAPTVEVCPSPGTGVTIAPPWPCTISVSGGGGGGIWSTTYLNLGDTTTVQPYTTANCTTNGAVPPTPCPFVAVGLNPDTSNPYVYPGTTETNPGGFAMGGQIMVGDPAGTGYPGVGECELDGAALGEGYMCATHAFCVGDMSNSGPACLEYHTGLTAYWEFDSPGGAGASNIRSTSFYPSSAVCTSSDTPPALVTGASCPFNGAQPTYTFGGAQLPNNHFDIGEVSVSCASSVTSCNTTQALSGSGVYSANTYDCVTASNSNTTGAAISNIPVSNFTTSSFTVTVVFASSTPHSGTVTVFTICNGS